MSTKTTLISALAMLVTSTAYAGPRDRLVKQLPTDSRAASYTHAAVVHGLQGDLATKRAQLAWANDWKHVSETEIYGIESTTELVITEYDDDDGAQMAYETEYDTEYVGDVEVDARLASEYRDVLEEQVDAIQARLELAEAKHDLFLAEQIAAHVKADFNVERWQQRHQQAADEYLTEWTEVEAAELAYREAGGTLSVRPLVAMDYQYETDGDVGDWTVERNITLQ